jgi:hypothetical protein
VKPLRWSSLKHLAESPAHYRYYQDHDLEPTPAMRFGSLVHAMLLGRAPNRFAVYDAARRGNAWRDFKEQHADLEIVTADEWARASDCADAAKADPVVAALLKQGLREHRCEWMVGTRKCAGTPDLNGDILVDFKVTPMTNPVRLPWHARKMLWHAQLDWYKYGLTSIGREISAVYLCALTPKPPHLAVVYQLTDSTLDLGRRQWRLLFERLLTCEASDQWPGYAQAPIPLDLDDAEPLELLVGGEEVTL